MRLIVLLQTCVLATGSVEFDGSCSEESDDVCLLQQRSFLEAKQAEQLQAEGLAKKFDFAVPPSDLTAEEQWAWMERHVLGITTEECPGSVYEAESHPGLCVYQGAEMLYTAAEVVPKVTLEEWFGDNVMIKELKYSQTDALGATVDFISPTTVDVHHFPVGNNTVIVTGYDLAGNDVECHRTVWIHDNEKPVFTQNPDDIDNFATGKLDENCTLSASAVFAEFEKLGWEATATDNCHNAHVQIKLLQQDGTVVYDSAAPEFHEVSPDSVYLTEGPGEYQVVYTAYDMHSNVNTWSPGFEAIDLDAPTKFCGCPEFTEPFILDAHIDTVAVEWTLPFVCADNCLDFGSFPDPIEQSVPEPKVPGMEFPVGVHDVNYVLKDPAGREMEEECAFTIEVQQKAHPVNLTCPPNQEVPTVRDAGFGIVEWPDPVATQGDVTLDSSHITIAHGVESGMPFPYGQTVVKVSAVGQITGTRIEEDERYAECEFTVTVTDPQDPEVDGRLYRCEPGDLSSHSVAPFGVCYGKEVTTHLHEGYTSSGVYDITGTVNLTMSLAVCCNNELGDPHSCQPVPGSNTVSYCVPSS